MIPFVELLLLGVSIATSYADMQMS